jgi:hypothetical protein
MLLIPLPYIAFEITTIRLLDCRALGSLDLDIVKMILRLSILHRYLFNKI